MMFQDYHKIDTVHPLPLTNHHHHHLSLKKISTSSIVRNLLQRVNFKIAISSL